MIYTNGIEMLLAWGISSFKRSNTPQGRNQPGSHHSLDPNKSLHSTSNSNIPSLVIPLGFDFLFLFFHFTNGMVFVFVVMKKWRSQEKGVGE